MAWGRGDEREKTSVKIPSKEYPLKVPDQIKSGGSTN
jgi:hypothetical protein